MGNNIGVASNNALVNANGSVTIQEIIQIGPEPHTDREEAQGNKPRKESTISTRILP